MASFLELQVTHYTQLVSLYITVGLNFFFDCKSSLCKDIAKINVACILSIKIR